MLSTKLFWHRRWLISAALACVATAASATETSTYTYDALGRLTSAARVGGSNSGTLIVTSFDAAGNRSAHGGAAPSGVTFSIASNGPVAEGTASMFTIVKSGSASTSLSVNYASAGITASSGSDFTATSGTLTFLASETSKTVSVPTTTDAVNENEEQFSMALSSPSAGSSLGIASAVANITAP